MSLELKFGYKILSTPDLLPLYAHAQSASQEYFSQHFSVKNKDVTEKSEYGYHRLPNKESYVIRNRDIPLVLKPCIPYIEHLHEIAKMCLLDIATELNLPKTNLLNLIDDEPLPKQGLSTSILRIVNYHSQNQQSTTQACRTHQDLGLLTLVPLSTVPALEAYDFTGAGEWVNVEAQLTQNKLAVLAGESLSLISNQYFIPCTHRVVNTNQPRLSIIYQLRVKPDVLLESRNFATEITGKFQQSFCMTGAEFYQQEIEKRTSVNGSY